MFRYLGVAAAAVLMTSALSQPASAQYMGYRFGGGSHERSWESPEVNNWRSARYDHLLQTNPAFRAYRTWKECRPINIPFLHQDCVQSFDQYEPMLAGYTPWPANYYGYGWRHHHHWRHWHRRW